MNCNITINDVKSLLCVGFVMRSLNALEAADVAYKSLSQAKL